MSGRSATSLPHLADGWLDVDNYGTPRIPLQDIVEEGIDIGYTTEELDRDLDRLRWSWSTIPT